VSIHFSFFFTLAELFFCSTQVKETTLIRTAQKYQNNVTLIVTVKDERGALSSWINLKSTAVAWVWIAGWP
jgi:hypothetical protein